MPVTFNVRSDKQTPGVGHVTDRAQRSDTGHVSGLSLSGEDEELKKALYGMEQMKVLMGGNWGATPPGPAPNHSRDSKHLREDECG